MGRVNVLATPSVSAGAKTQIDIFQVYYRRRRAMATRRALLYRKTCHELGLTIEEGVLIEFELSVMPNPGLCRLDLESGGCLSKVCMQTRGVG